MLIRIRYIINTEIIISLVKYNIRKNKLYYISTLTVILFKRNPGMKGKPSIILVIYTFLFFFSNKTKEKKEKRKLYKYVV